MKLKQGNGRGTCCWNIKQIILLSELKCTCFIHLFNLEIILKIKYCGDSYYAVILEGNDCLYFSGVIKLMWILKLNKV